MSHLQPKFIAKAKAAKQQSQKLRSMVRGMRVREATRTVTAPLKRKVIPGEPYMAARDIYPPDHQLFVLNRKDK